MSQKSIQYIASLKYPVAVLDAGSLYRGRTIEVITIESEAGSTKVRVISIVNSQGREHKFENSPVIWLEDWNVSARQYL